MSILTKGIGIAVKGFGKALTRNLGNRTASKISNKMSKGEKAIIGASSAIATAGAAATGYGYKKAFDKLEEIKEKKK